MFTAAARVPVN